MAKRRFRVQWAEAAVRDFEELVSFIAMDSELDADRVLSRLGARSATLESSPGRGRLLPELARFGMRTWRELIVKPYRLIYRIEGEVVNVLAVFDGHRDLEDLLLERLLRGN
jgi:plasmid stabilization system protein ParE